MVIEICKGGFAVESASNLFYLPRKVINLPIDDTWLADEVSKTPAWLKKIDTCVSSEIESVQPLHGFFGRTISGTLDMSEWLYDENLASLKIRLAEET